MLVATPTLASVKNSRFVLDLFDKMNYAPEKTLFVLNKVEDERARDRVTIPTETIEKYIKRQAIAKIPIGEQMILSAVNKGIPVIASKERTKSPVKELISFAEQMYIMLMGGPADQDAQENDDKKKSSKIGFGRR